MTVQSNLPSSDLDRSDRRSCASSCWNGYLSFLASITHAFERFFGLIGRKAALYPTTFVVISLVVGLALSSGWARLPRESRPERLWVPQDSRAIQALNFVDANYGSRPRFNRFIAVSRTPNANMLTKDILLSMMNLHEQIVSATFTFGGQTRTLSSICLPGRLPNSCNVQSVLEFWSFNRTALELDSAPLNTIFGSTVTPISLTPLVQVLGGVNQVSRTAQAIRSIYLVSDAGKTNENQNPEKEAWESVFESTIDSFSASQSSIVVYKNAQRSFGDALSSAISGDLLLLFSGFALMMIYLCIALGRFHRVHSRILLAIGGLMSVGLAIGASTGFGSWIGIPYGVVNSVIPFIAIGIGVDDIFVIVNAYDRTDPHLDVPERISRSLSRSGTAISITSFTNILAFVVGVSSSLPAISSFCAYVTLAVVFDYIFQATFFVALLSWDARRQNANRYDCCPCCSVDGSQSDGDSSQARELEVYSTNHSIPPEEKGFPENTNSVSEANEGNGIFHRFFREYYGPFITRPVVKVVVLFVFTVLVGISIAGALNLRQDFQVTDLTPSDSFVIPYLRAEEKFFESQIGPSVSFLLTQPLDYSLVSTQDEILNFQQAVLSSPWIESSLGIRSWLSGFRNWVIQTNSGSDGRVGGSQFYDLLRTYLNGPGIQFRRDFQDSLVFPLTSLSASDMKTTQFSATLKPLFSNSDRVSAMRAMYALSDQFAPRGVPSLAWSPPFLFFEQYAVVEREILQNLALAGAMVFLVTLVLLVHPFAAFLSLCMVAVVDILLLGLMFAWNLSIDSVSATNLVLSVGLAVDYVVHILHAFMHSSGTRDQRVRKALSYMGTSVSNGAATTFLGIIMLAASKTAIFVNFFRQLFGTVLFGWTVSLSLLPVLLSLIGPAQVASDAEFEDSSYSRKSVDSFEKVTPVGMISMLASQSAPENIEISGTSSSSSIFSMTPAKISDDKLSSNETSSVDDLV